MQVPHTLVEAPYNPQCIGAHPKLKASTIRNTTIQQAQHKNTNKRNTRTRQAQYKNTNKRNTTTLKQRDRNAEGKKP
jgi:hypothetical protein